jgi:protein-tyrosine phosphatase
LLPDRPSSVLPFQFFIFSILWITNGRYIMLKQKLLSRFGPEPTGLSEKEQMRIALINMKLADEDGDVHFVELPLFSSGKAETAITSEAQAGRRKCGRLAIGGVGAALHMENLQATGITHILCLSKQVRTMFPDSFSYMRVDELEDDGSGHSLDIFRNHLEHCLQFIHESISIGGSVLVHCYQGKSRSAAMCIAYLLTKFDESQVPTLERALGLIRQSRPKAEPNFALMSVLREIETKTGRTSSSDDGRQTGGHSTVFAQL